MSLSRRLLGGVLVLALAGCKGEPERPSEPPLAEHDSAAAEPALPVNPFAEPARRALRIELALDDYRRVDGAWEAGDTASTFTAYFAGDTLRFIEEQVTLSAHERTNVFYFEKGALFYAVQDEIRPGSGAGTQRDTARTRIALDPGGGVVASEHVLNGVSEPVQRATVVGVRNHAEALREQAIARLREATGPAV